MYMHYTSILYMYIIITCALENLSAIDRVIFRWVWLSVECGLNVILFLNTACPCKPEPEIYYNIVGKILDHTHLAAQINDYILFVMVVDEYQIFHFPNIMTY